jgi:hypothetical protein
MKNEAHFLELDVLQTYVKMIVPLQKKPNIRFQYIRASIESIIYKFMAIFFL